MKTGSIDTSKIDKAHLIAGKTGKKYLSITLHENKNGTDEYGNDGFITQGVSKEAREQGVKGPIIGNWRRVQKKVNVPKSTNTAPVRTAPKDDDGSDVPF